MSISEKEILDPDLVTERLVLERSSLAVTVEVVAMPKPAPSMVNWGEVVEAPVFWAEM